MDVVETKPEYDIGVEQHSEDGLVDNVDGLHRRLSNRQIQFIAIGGNSNECLVESYLLTHLIKAPLGLRFSCPSLGAFLKAGQLLSCSVS